MIKSLKMTLNYDTGSRYHMEARSHSLPKPIIENTTSDGEKATKTGMEDNVKIMENKINNN